MKIELPARPDASIRQAKADLERLQAGLSGRAGRPCAGCDLRCPSCGSSGCTCRCGYRCPAAARALTSDPARYPIEPGILPLVYALRAMQVAAPCWSCEGHLAPDGSLFRLPSVWFTVSSLEVLGCLAECLAGTRQAPGLQASWHVEAIDCGERRDAIFALHPETPESRDIGAVGLAGLQRDVQAIADSLLGRMGPLVARRLAAL